MTISYPLKPLYSVELEKQCLQMREGVESDVHTFYVYFEERERERATKRSQKAGFRDLKVIVVVVVNHSNQHHGSRVDVIDCFRGRSTTEVSTTEMSTTGVSTTGGRLLAWEVRIFRFGATQHSGSPRRSLDFTFLLDSACN